MSTPQRYKLSTGTAALILNPSGLRHAPVILPPGTETQYPLNKKVGGPQSQSGRSGRNCLAPTGTRNPDRPGHSLIATTTTLFQLQYLLIFQPKCGLKKR